jgi:hypothetical protein
MEALVDDVEAESGDAEAKEEKKMWRGLDINALKEELIWNKLWVTRSW